MGTGKARASLLLPHHTDDADQISRPCCKSNADGSALPPPLAQLRWKGGGGPAMGTGKTQASLLLSSRLTMSTKYCGNAAKAILMVVRSIRTNTLVSTATNVFSRSFASCPGPVEAVWVQSAHRSAKEYERA